MKFTLNLRSKKGALLYLTPVQTKTDPRDVCECGDSREPLTPAHIHSFIHTFAHQVD